MATDKNGKKLPKGIRQRSNGTFEGRIMFEYENYTVYGTSISEVKKKMTELRYKLEHGIYVDKSKVTLTEWFETWMNEYKKGNVKVGTVIAYNNCFNYYVKKELGTKRLFNIRGEHIQRLYNQLEEKGIAVSYIKIVAAILNGCFKQALKNGLIEKNPVELATVPKEREKKIRRVLTMEEQKVFMQYAKESYLYNLFALDLRTGLRGGEIRGLKYTDIDRNSNVIHVNRTLKYESGIGFFEDTPKTRTSKRDIPLTDDMIQILKAQKEYFHGKEVFRIDGYIFHLEDGSPISRERVQNEINRIVRRINKDNIHFEPFTLHCLRHTFATRAIENGMKPQTLKAILGHSSLAMTMDLYSHVLPSTKADEMEAISKAFAG